MPDGSTLQIVIMIVLIAFSAFFSASETAYTSFNRTKMKNLASEGNKRAARALKHSNKLTLTLRNMRIEASGLGHIVSAALEADAVSRNAFKLGNNVRELEIGEAVKKPLHVLFVFFKRKRAGRVYQPAARRDAPCHVCKYFSLPFCAHLYVLKAPFINRTVILSEHSFSGTRSIHQNLIKEHGKYGR